MGKKTDEVAPTVAPVVAPDAVVAPIVAPTVDIEPIDSHDDVVAPSVDDVLLTPTKADEEAIIVSEEVKKKAGKYQKKRATKEIEKDAEKEEKNSFLKLVVVVSAVSAVAWFLILKPLMAYLSNYSKSEMENEVINGTEERNEERSTTVLAVADSTGGDFYD